MRLLSIRMRPFGRRGHNRRLGSRFDLDPRPIDRAKVVAHDEIKHRWRARRIEHATSSSRRIHDGLLVRGSRENQPTSVSSRFRSALKPDANACRLIRLRSQIDESGHFVPNSTCVASNPNLSRATSKDTGVPSSIDHGSRPIGRLAKWEALEITYSSPVCCVADRDLPDRQHLLRPRT